VDFKATTGTLGTTALIQAGTTNTNGLIGGWATVNGGTEFASNSNNGAAGYVVAATSTGGDLGDSGLASNSALNFKPSGTQTDLTSAKAFNSLNFSGSTGANLTGSGAITAASGGMIYNSTGGITGGTLAGSASGELILHTAQALSLGSTSIINNGGATALTKSGAGTLTLGTTNTYSGNTTINAGTLTLGASVQGADSINRQMLTGSGSVTGATTIGNFGTHNAGDNGVGKQTLSSSLTYDSGSIFEWDLAATPATTGRGTAYDAVNAASLGSTTGAIFRVVLNGAQDFSSTFWDTNQTWTDIFKTGDAGTNLSFATIFSGGVQYYNESGVLTGVTSTQGAFTMSGSTLSWSAVPEPTSAMAGLLLTAGLLRRRRKN
jgi:autotransporter-associated beta strand protein